MHVYTNTNKKQLFLFFLIAKIISSKEIVLVTKKKIYEKFKKSYDLR